MDHDLVDRFTNPPRNFGPTPLWWWSGAQITTERIDFQLDKFVAGGIHDLVLMNLAPKGPTYGAPPDDPAWFSERWWELVSYTCQRAADLGIRLWFYDQIGFSGANVQGSIVADHPEAAGQTLHSWTAVVGPDGEMGAGARDHVIGIYAGRSDGGWQRLSDGPIEPGTSVRVVVWRETAFDYLSVEACARLLDAIHGEFDRRLPDELGSVIVGSFQDELPAMPTWSAGFTGAFTHTHGYDLLDHLPSLWERGGPGDDAVRSDYHRTRTDLAEEAFFKPLGRWHADRGMLFGADQTNPARSGQPTQSSQLYGDYFATHRWVNAVGSDHEGDARVHSSMADLYDHPRVWIESFHSSGWGGTLADTWDWLLPFFRSGADLYNPHATYFDTRAGWFEWAPPSTDFRQPYYELYPAFATAVARTAAMLTWGRHLVDIGVLYPAATGHAELMPDEPIDYFDTGQIGAGYERTDAAQSTYVHLAGRNDWFRSEPGLLDQAGLDFDVIDEASVRGGRVMADDGGHLHAGSVALGIVVLPAITHLQPGTADRLLALLDAGGRVLVVRADPEQVTGRGASDEDRAVLQALLSHPRLERCGTPQEARDILARRGTGVWASTGVRARHSGNTVAAFVPAAFPNATAYPVRKDFPSLAWSDLDVDPGRYADDVDLHVRGPVTDAQIWDPATGNRRPATTRRTDDGHVITVDLNGAPAAFAVWRTDGSSGGDDAALTALPAPAGKARRSSPLNFDAWTHELLPTLDNTWGDMDLPAGRDVPLEIWRMRWRDASGQDVDVRATFGQEVLTSGPSAQVPPPLSASAAREVLAGGDLAAGTHEQWSVQRYSASRGRDTDAVGKYEPKGFVPEEFLIHDAPPAGQWVSVRTILRLPAPGDYDLTVAAAAAKRVWVDGVEVSSDGTEFASVIPVSLSGDTLVLEYQIGPSEAFAGVHGTRPATIASWFMVEQSAVARPEFISPAFVTDGVADLRTRFSCDDGGARAVLTAGGTAALSIYIDGVPVARQEKVQYYESAAVNRPMYFTHEVGELSPGEHELRVVAESADAEHAVFLDMVMTDRRGRLTNVVSNARWWTAADVAHRARSQPVTVVRGLGEGVRHAHTAQLPHPLPATSWLTGPPAVGNPAVDVQATISLTPRPQEFAITLPAGAVEAHLPVSGAHQVWLDGKPEVLTGGSLELPNALTAPAKLTVRTAPRAFNTGGAAWDGPVRVRTAPWTGPLADWRDAGLGAWSGAIRSEITIDGEREQRLNLGTVRGAVTVHWDGELLAEAFCGPYVFELPQSQGQHTLAVTVYGTLAPRLDSVSPTAFIPPSQLATGVLGPVTLEVS